jgi:hypothetical protein
VYGVESVLPAARLPRNALAYDMTAILL